MKARLTYIFLFLALPAAALLYFSFAPAFVFHFAEQAFSADQTLAGKTLDEACSSLVPPWTGTFPLPRYCLATKVQAVGWWCSLFAILAALLLQTIVKAADPLGRRSVQHLAFFLRWGWNASLFLLALIPMATLMALGIILDDLTLVLFDALTPFAGILAVLGLLFASHIGFVAIECRKQRQVEVIGSLHRPEDSPDLFHALTEGRLLAGLPAADQAVACTSPLFLATEDPLNRKNETLEGTTFLLPLVYLPLLPRNEAQTLAAGELAKVQWDRLTFPPALLNRPFLEFQSIYIWRSKIHAALVEPLRHFLDAIRENTQGYQWQRSKHGDQEAIKRSSHALWENALVRLHLLEWTWTSLWEKAGNRPLEEARQRLPAELALCQNLKEEERKSIGLLKVQNPFLPNFCLEDRLAAQGESWEKFDTSILGLNTPPALTLLSSREETNRMEENFRTEDLTYLSRMKRRESAAAADLGTPEGRALLEKEFPHVVYRNRPWLTLLHAGALCLIGLAPFVIGNLSRPDNPAWFLPMMLVTSALLAGTGLQIFHQYWHRNLELSIDGFYFPQINGLVPLSEISSISCSGANIKIDLKPGTRVRWRPFYFKWVLIDGSFSVDTLHLEGRAEEMAERMQRYYGRIPYE